MNKADLFKRLRIMLVSLTTQAVVGIADYVTSDELHLEVFYFIPVTICAWYLRRGEVVVSALIGALTWGYADIRSGHHYSNPAYWYWNMFVSFSSLLILGLVVKALRENLEKKEQARLELLRTLTDLQKSTAETEKLRGQLQVVCAWTKRIQVGGRWLTFEEFLKDQLHVTVSHGMSPQAMEQFSKEMDGQKENP